MLCLTIVVHEGLHVPTIIHGLTIYCQIQLSSWGEVCHKLLCKGKVHCHNTWPSACVYKLITVVPRWCMYCLDNYWHHSTPSCQQSTQLDNCVPMHIVPGMCKFAVTGELFFNSHAYESMGEVPSGTSLWPSWMDRVWHEEGHQLVASSVIHARKEACMYIM